MNLDNPNDVMPPFHHKFLMNGRFRGNGGNMRLENIPGNILIPNYALPAGTNQCIGGFYDTVKRRIIWFNFNSNGRNGIYQYSVQTKAITKIFLCFTDSTTDILSFSRDLPIHSASIVYRTESDGDLLYWTDGQFGEGNRPRGLNIDTVSTLTPFTENMINAAKDAPLNRPSVFYEDDATKTVNNLRKLLFQFCYRWVYKNLDKSTLSPISKLALPINGYNVDTQNDPTLNNNIEILFRTGPSDFQSVEILGRVSEGQAYGDLFSVITLDRDDYNLTPDTNSTFNFYNDGNYIVADVTDADKTFSYLPDIANCLELLNGNVIIYGGITDGYDAILRADTDIIVGAGVSNPNIASFTFVYGGTHTIFALVGSVVVPGITYHIHFDYSSGLGGDASPKNVNYVSIIGDSQTSVANAIIALLNGNNIICSNLGAGYIQIGTTGGTSGTFSNVDTTVSTAGTQSSSSSWKPACPERLGVIYFDDMGKTNGVVYFPQNDIDTNVFDTSTPIFTVSSNVIKVPFLTGSINSTPPSWAVSYQWVRVPMTPTFLQWVTNDYQPETNFLYFCIENLTYTQTKTSGYVPSYDFSKGDRVKVLASFDLGTGFYTPYSVQLDMEILGVEDRIMTAPASMGRFVKVAKPTTFPSAPYVLNMLIELYTPFVRSAATDQIFFEWGEKYDIDETAVDILTYTIAFGTFQVGETIIEAVTNATAIIETVSPTQLTVTNITGTFLPNLTFTGLTSGAAGTITVVTASAPNRFHSGMITDQNSGQPATFQWFDGDIYFKERQFYLNVGDTDTVSVFMFDANYSDYFASKVNSNGRGWAIEPNAKTTYNPVQVRWGGQYQQDTNINKLNIFQPLDFDTIDRAKGDICRLMTEDRLLYVYQQHGVGNFGIYSKYIQNNEGQPQLVTTDSIITPNNINYLQGNYGLGNQPCALWRGKGEVHFFNDDTRGDQLRRSGDGIDNISELYYGQYFLRDLISKYNSTYLRPDGSKAKIFGFFDHFENNSQCILQGGTYSGQSIADYNYSFHNGNDPVRGFRSFYSYFPDWALQAEDITYSWKNGQLYSHTNEVNGHFTEFYLIKYYPTITLVFNKDVNIKKTLDALAYQGNQYWVADTVGDINTSQPNGETGLPQISGLSDFDFDIQEGLFYAGLKRDANSMADSRLALYEGDFLKGVWVEIKLTYKGNDRAYLYLPYVKYDVSQRNF